MFQTSDVPAVGTAQDVMRAERLMTVTLMLGALLFPLNSTMIAVGLTRVVDAFGIDLASAGWLVTGFLIAMVCLQPVGGKLGDRLGRRPMIIGGMIWFLIASLGAALATNFVLLMIFRVQQAAAGALAMPNGVALVREVVPEERRGIHLGMLGVGMSIGGAIGLPLGGVLVDLAGWRAIFAVNVFFVVPALLLAWRSIPSQAPRGERRPFDLVGVALLFGVLIGIALLLNSSPNTPLMTLLPAVLVLLVAAAVFVWLELRHPDPVVQPRLFRTRPFTAAVLCTACNNLVYFSALLMLPVLLTQMAGWTASRIGLSMAAVSASIVAGAPLGGQLADRLGRRWSATAGLVLMTTGVVLLALLQAGISVALLLGGLALLGFGAGLSGAGIQANAIESVTAEESGMASGLMLTSLYLGCITSASILARLLNAVRDGSGSFAPIFTMMIAVACLSTLLSLSLLNRPSVQRTSGQQLAHEDRSG